VLETLVMQFFAILDGASGIELALLSCFIGANGYNNATFR
jgi:hypothetical protein